MALQCPQCGNPIEADFGVVTCSRCQSVLFIDLEGQIQLSDAPDSHSTFEVMRSSPAEASSENPVHEDFQDSWMQDQNPAAVEAPGGLDVPFETPVDMEPHSIQDLENQERLPDSIQEMPTEFVSENEVDDELTIPAREAHDLSEVAEFSNADQAYGPLSYSVTIEEIDTKEARQLLAEALNDPKFQWDSRELLKKIKMGKLHFENLNPVKASVLVHRLQSLPVKVSWTQNVFS